MNINVTADTVSGSSVTYAPVYLIQSKDSSQEFKVFSTQQEVTAYQVNNENLKTYYENSGHIVNEFVKQPALQLKNDQNNTIVANYSAQNCKTSDNSKVGNEYSGQHKIAIVRKTALPKSNKKNSCIPVTMMPYVLNKVPFPKTNNDNIKPVPKKNVLPKLRPKVETTASSNHSSVQILKLGGAYHSLSNLNDEQMRIVSQALQKIGDPETDTLKPTYDAATNTRIIYKVRSPSDLALVGNKQIIINNPIKNNNVQKTELISVKKKNDSETNGRNIKRAYSLADARPLLPKPSDESKRDPIPIAEPSNPRVLYKVVTQNGVNKKLITNENVIQKKEPSQPEVTDLETQAVNNNLKVRTRSGRSIKLPKHIQDEQTGSEKVNRPRKKINNMFTCHVCEAEFCGIYRLHRHYEKFPLHITGNSHTNLFHCLLAIVKSSNPMDSTCVLVQQLEQLIEKLKSLLPCLLKKIDGQEGKQCIINEDIGRLFGMSPGKYNLNEDALTCTKDQGGHCKHNPPKITSTKTDLPKPSQIWLSKHKEETANEIDNEVCARTNSIEKWPPYNKRTWKHKQKQSEENVKAKKRLLTESTDTNIDPVNENHVNLDEPTISLDSKNKNVADTKALQLDSANETQNNPIQPTMEVKFHSTHFDIRSSPMKPSSIAFNKFQINSHTIATKSGIEHIIKPSTITIMETDDQENLQNVENSIDLQRLIKELNGDTIILENKDLRLISNDMNYEKQWINSNSVDQNDMQACNGFHESLLQGNPSASDEVVSTDGGEVNVNDNSLPNSQSVMNFLDAISHDLVFPEAELRNNTIDLPLDLFSFNNS